MRISAFWENISEAARQSGEALPKLLDRLRLAGLETVCINHSQSLKPQKDEVLRLLERVGLPVEGLWDNLAFHAMDDAETRAAYTELIDCAAETGAKHVLIVPGAFHAYGERCTREEAAAREPEIRRMIEGVRAARAYGDSRGVTVTMEDYDVWNAPVVYPEILRRFFEEIPGLMCAFDTGNFVPCDADVLEAFAFYRDRVAAVHLKDRSADPGGREREPLVSEAGRRWYPAAVGSGEMHIAEIVGALQEQRYAGPGIIELFGSADMEEKLFASIRWMKAHAKRPLADEPVEGQVCVGVIGSGAISGIYLQNMTTRFPILRVKSLASKHREHAQKRADEYGVQCVTTEEMLADPEIRLVVNLTPVEAHYPLVKAALEAGKHVYTEKPLTDDPARSRELRRLALEKGLYLGGAPDTFLGSCVQTAKAALEAGRIGRVTGFVFTASRDWELLMNMFSFLRVKGPGMCYDYAVYPMTALVSLLGPVARVAAFTSEPGPYRHNFPDDPLLGQEMLCPNETRVSAALQMASGVTGTLMLDGDSVARDETVFRLYGTKGILELGDPNEFGQPARLLLSSTEQPWEKRAYETLPDVNPYSDNSRGLGVSEMARAILRGGSSPVDAWLPCHVQEVLSAILQSSRTGAFVDVPAVGEA